MVAVAAAGDEQAILCGEHAVELALLGAVAWVAQLDAIEASLHQRLDVGVVGGHGVDALASARVGEHSHGAQAVGHCNHLVYAERPVGAGHAGEQEAHACLLVALAGHAAGQLVEASERGGHVGDIRGAAKGVESREPKTLGGQLVYDAAGVGGVALEHGRAQGEQRGRHGVGAVDKRVPELAAEGAVELHPAHHPHAVAGACCLERLHTGGAVMVGGGDHVETGGGGGAGQGLGRPAGVMGRGGGMNMQIDHRLVSTGWPAACQSWKPPSMAMTVG